jgi:ribulose-phosphate 3-epimerase
LARLAEIRSRMGAAFRLGVDGGIAADTVGAVAEAGAELIVAGSSIIRSRDYARAIAELEAIARNAA